MLFGLHLQFDFPNQLEEIMYPIPDTLLYILQLHEIIEGDDIVLVEDPLLAVRLGYLDQNLSHIRCDDHE